MANRFDQNLAITSLQRPAGRISYDVMIQIMVHEIEAYRYCDSSWTSSDDSSDNNDKGIQCRVCEIEPGLGQSVFPMMGKSRCK